MENIKKRSTWQSRRKFLFSALRRTAAAWNRKALIAAVLLLTPFALSVSAEAAIVKPEDLDDRSLVGQTVTLWFEGPSLSEEVKEMIRDYRIGGVILFSKPDNLQNPAQIARLIGDLQNCAKGWGVPPLFVAVDQEGGRVARLREEQGCTHFPPTGDIASLGDPALIRAAASASARQIRKLGFNWNCVPCLDLNSNPANPIIGSRALGSEPERVLSFGREILDAHKEARVMTSVKHFPGHGDTSVDSHVSLPRVDRSMEELEGFELLPFKGAVESGVPAVMTAHILAPKLDAELPATLSPAILSILRDRWKFQGLIVTDSMGMGAIVKKWTLPLASRLALNAGVDVLLFGADGHSREDQLATLKALYEDLQSGLLSREKLRRSAARILAAKEALGLFDDPMPTLKDGEIPQTEADAALAQHIDELLNR